MLGILETTRSPEVAFAAGQALAFINTKAATHPLMKAASGSPFEPARHSAVLALWLLADQRSEQLLIKILRDETDTERVRGAAAEALGSLRPERVLKAVQEALTDKSDFVRSSARCALEALTMIKAVQQKSRISK